MSKDSKSAGKSLGSADSPIEIDSKNQLPSASGVRPVVCPEQAPQLPKEIGHEVKSFGNTILYEALLGDLPADLRGQIDEICRGNGRVVGIFSNVFTKYGLSGLKILIDLRGIYIEDGYRVTFSDIDVIKAIFDNFLKFAKESNTEGEPILALFHRLICSSPVKELVPLIAMVGPQMYLMNTAEFVGCLGEALTYNWSYTELIVWMGNHKNLIQLKMYDSANDCLRHVLGLEVRSKNRRN